MTQYVPRLPFSLDPLIAEARRRARQRRVLLAAIVLVFGLGAGGTTLLVHPFGWFRTSRPYTGPYEPGGIFRGPGGFGPAASWPGMQAVSAASRSDAWIVGSLARRWDGQAWIDVPLPRISGSELSAVATIAPDDAWAAGWRSQGASPNYALIEHWNGARWSIAQLPRLHRSLLYSISAAGPRSAWAVGVTFRPNPDRRYANQRPLLLRWDGASWRKPPLPWAYNTLQLSKVVATGPSSVWVIGQASSRSRIEHWNGTRWRLVPAPFGSNDPLTAFSATAWNDAWAVGSYSQPGNEVVKLSHALAAHWNGHHWQITPVPNPPGDTNSAALLDVAAARPNDAWAIGESTRLNYYDHGVTQQKPPSTYFLHWNGENWQATSDTTPPLYDGSTAITAAPDGSAWAIGNCPVDDFSVRWNSESWVTAPHPPDTHWRTNGPVTLPAKLRRSRPPTCWSHG